MPKILLKYDGFTILAGSEWSQESIDNFTKKHANDPKWDISVIPNKLSAEESFAVEMIDKVSIRDYFAVHCPASVLNDSTSSLRTVGDIKSALGKHNYSESYTDKERNELMMRIKAKAAYQYADAMLKARSNV